MLSLHCPHGYCNSDLNLSVFHYRNDKTYKIMSNDLSTNSSLCLNNREGILCSNCSAVNGINYSVVFGSTECRQCSNWWLWTLVLYAVAGPFLIYLLYVLRLTLTIGTLNGIIFYAQVASTGLSDILSIKDMQCSQGAQFGMKVALFFLSTLNLNLEWLSIVFLQWNVRITKSWLQFTISILSPDNNCCPHYPQSFFCKDFQQHSSLLSSSTGYCCTPLLFKAVINNRDIFTPVQLYSSTRKEVTKVWFNDGYITYGEGEHFVLMIVTSVIVGIFLIPYMLIILTGHLLMKSNKIREYLRPIYEAIHAPYKYNKQYWFTARQLLLICVCILYAMY